MSQQMTQKVIDELVERFYDKLIKKDYFKKMFEEREVDIELLKERQRSFLSRLTTEESEEERVKYEKQVAKRHPFKTTPERADLWFNTLEETVNEMGIDGPVKNRFLGRIHSLLKTLLK